MKLLIRLVLILIVAVALAAGALFFLPGERIARIAADQISSMTGRKVEMSGDTTVSFYPVLGISTGATTISNADWSNSGPILKAESLKVGVDPLALIKGDIRITGLEAVRPSIILERARDGRVNWEIGVDGVAPSGQSGDAASASSNRLALTLDRALIDGASLIYIDHAAGTRTEMKDMDLDLRWPSYQGEALFAATVRPAGEAVNITGRVAKVGTLIEGGISDLNATISAEGGTLSFDGRGSSIPQLEGQFQADLQDTSMFLTSLGLAPVEIPKGFGQSLSLDTQLTVTDDMQLSLREMVLALDQNRLTGGVDAMMNGDKPRVAAQLTAGALDLSALESGSSDTSGGGEGTSVTDGWPKDVIDASALGLIDGEFALRAESLNLGTFQFERTRVLAAIDRSRAVFNIEELQGYGGSVSGEFVANNRSGLSVGGDMRADGIDMERFLTDAAGISRFATSGQARLKFLGSGQTVDAIMKSLDGSLSINTGRGVISGFDLDKLMRSGDGTGGTTVFDQMSTSFTITDGNMHNNDLAMSMPLARAEGKGRIGLGAQDIDYLLTPVLLEGETTRGFAIPVRIRGPWVNPRIWPDIEEAINANFKAEKDKLEDKVEEEVTDFVKDELGLNLGEGQSVEDAIEEAVIKEIFNLFD